MEEYIGHPFYSCKKCRNPLALRDDLLSKAIKARSGQAYMFSQVMNIVVGPRQVKQLLTGKFTVAEIYCSKCGEVLGWKYLRAHDELQKYKMGRYIVERSKILKEY